MVIIDPYRGGEDSGYINNNIIEKDFNLMISKYIYNRLKELGIDTVITREGDNTLSDIDRSNIINKYNGIAISNRLNYGNENGVEIEYSLSNNIPNRLENAFNDRDIYVNKVYQKRDETDTSKDNDNLLKNTNTETIIINYGYINNNDDINNVINNYGRTEISGGTIVSESGTVAALHNKDTGTMIITDGTITTSESQCMALYSVGNLTVSGGTFTSTYYAIYASGTRSVTGGTFNGPTHY